MNIILDTNILISTLLFRGTALPLYKAILQGTHIAHICPSIFREYQQVLQYKKFKLSHEEINYLINEEIIPFFTFHAEPEKGQSWIPEDPEDNKFIDLARAIPGSLLVSGDTHVLSKQNELPCTIVSLAEFIEGYCKNQ